MRINRLVTPGRVRSTRKSAAFIATSVVLGALWIPPQISRAVLPDEPTSRELQRPTGFLFVTPPVVGPFIPPKLVRPQPPAEVEPAKTLSNILFFTPPAIAGAFEADGIGSCNFTVSLPQPQSPGTDGGGIRIYRIKTDRAAVREKQSISFLYGSLGFEADGIGGGFFTTLGFESDGIGNASFVAEEVVAAFFDADGVGGCNFEGLILTQVEMDGVGGGSFFGATLQPGGFEADGVGNAFFFSTSGAFIAQGVGGASFFWVYQGTIGIWIVRGRWRRTVLMVCWCGSGGGLYYRSGSRDSSVCGWELCVLNAIVLWDAWV